MKKSKNIPHQKRKTNFVFLFMVLISMGGTFSNDKTLLPVLNMQNQSLIKIIDSIIQHEKKCDYYNENLLFSIHLQEISEGSLDIQIESIGNKIVQLGNEKGCIEHKGHLFFVSGVVNSDLFSKTRKTKNITYYEPKSGMNPKTEEPILDVIEEDRFSIWVYNYVDDDFTLDSHHTNCD